MRFLRSSALLPHTCTASRRSTVRRRWRGASVTFYFLRFTLFSLVLLAACSPQPLPTEPTSIPTLIPATLPAEAGSASQPGAGPEEHPGAAIFDASCLACHNLTAERKVGPGLAGLFERDALPSGNPVTDENLREWIRNGGGAMPGIPLSDSDLDTLLGFLHQKVGSTVSGSEPASEQGGMAEMELGQQAFEAYCSVCHNLSAEPKVGPGLVGLFERDVLPNGNPVTDENLEAWILSGGGAMPGVPVPDEELAALLVFLRDVTQ